VIALFWTCAILILVSQLMILRSTRRAHRGVGRGELPPGTAAPRTGPLEWAFAIGPAIALVVLLVATWRAATRPASMDVRFDAGQAITAHRP
jgi:hypothetical protein